MRKTFKSMAGFIFLIMGTFIGGVWFSSIGIAYAETPSAQIVVSGSGAISVTPDAAMVSLGVETVAATAQEAQQKNATATNSLIATMRLLKIADDNIATQNYSISPIYNYSKQDDNAPPIITSYRVSNSVNVTINDVKRIGTIIDAAVKAGGNQVQNIQFMRENILPAQLEAMQQACLQARMKASTLSKTLGLSIIGIQSVQESGSSTSQPLMLDQLQKAGTSNTPIQPGMLQVTADVTIIYLVK